MKDIQTALVLIALQQGLCAFSWWVGGWWEGSFAARAALIVWLAYVLIDIAVLVAAGLSTKVAILFAVSFFTKLAAVYWGALTRIARA